MKTYKELFEQVVPASAKIDSIDNQYLSPETHDKNVRSRVFGAMKTFDGEEFQAVTFTSGDNLTKDKSKDDHTTDRGNPEMPTISENRMNTINRLMGQPRRSTPSETANRDRESHRFGSSQGGDSSNYKDKDRKKDIKEDIDDVIDAYIEDSYNLTSEIFDLLDNLGGVGRPSQETLKYTAASLRCARDALLNSMERVANGDVAEGVVVTENFKSGKLNLDDGSSVRLTAADAKALNQMLDSTSAKKNMQKDLMKSKSDFKAMLSFAKDLNEQTLQESRQLIEVSDDKIDRYIDKAYLDAMDAENKGDLKRFIKRTSGLTRAYHSRTRQSSIKNLYKRLGMDKDLKESEQLEEISDKLANKYKRKAHKSNDKAWEKRDLETVGKRTRGIGLAGRREIRKRMQEDIQIGNPVIDEVSRSTLNKYLKKAIDSHTKAEFGQDKDYDTAAKRRKGIIAAIARKNRGYSEN